MLRAEFGDSFYEIHLHPAPDSGCRIASEQLILTTGDKTLKLVSSDTVETGIFAGAHEDPSWESFRLHLQNWTTYRFQSEPVYGNRGRAAADGVFVPAQTDGTRVP